MAVKERSKIMDRDKSSKSKMTIGRNLCVWSLVLAMMAAIAVGDVGSAPADKAGTDWIKVFQRADEEGFGIRDALAMLGRQTGKNIVPTSSVDGPVAFRRLTNVTFDEVMDAILGEKFVYEQKGSLIKVYTKEEYKRIKTDTDRLVYKVFTLYYITAADAAKLLEPVLSAASVIQTSTPAEAEITGGGGEAGAGGGSLGSSGGDSLAINDTIVLYDFPENIAEAEKIIAAIDVRPKQVLIEATILSATLTEDMELGVDLSFAAGVSWDGIADISSITDGTPIEAVDFATADNPGLRVGISTGDVRMFITALEQITATTVLANPKVLTVNKQEGSVLIGTNLGYRSSTTISSGGVATEGQVEFLQTGTQLVFRPYIGDDGYIRMDIYPKDSSAALNADGVPTETTTQLKTNIVVKDGETIVLGGLFRDVVTTTRNQVPLLGDIPLIGALFRGTNDETRREEVIILLTPHIIDAADQTDGEARLADIARKRYGARTELQWVGRPRLADDHYVNAVRHYANGNNVEALAEADAALALRPAYLEAMRLKERILGEVSPDEVSTIERIMLDVIEQEEAAWWRRR
jgi:type II secretory pathway component GspD/PulD (secretin)